MKTFLSHSLLHSVFTADFTGLKSETHSLVKVKSVVLSAQKQDFYQQNIFSLLWWKDCWVFVCSLANICSWKIAFDVHSAVVRLKLDFIFAKNQCAYPDSVGWWQMLAIAGLLCVSVGFYFMFQVLQLTYVLTSTTMFGMWRSGTFLDHYRC